MSLGKESEIPTLRLSGRVRDRWLTELNSPGASVAPTGLICSRFYPLMEGFVDVTAELNFAFGALPSPKKSKRKADGQFVQEGLSFVFVPGAKAGLLAGLSVLAIEDFAAPVESESRFHDSGAES